MALLSPQEVFSRIGSPNTVIIDARGGPDAQTRYDSGHITGAYFADLETDLSTKKKNAAEGGRHPLPDVAAFGAFLGKLGITPDTHVIVYDDKGGANAAARLWWMMKSIGHTHVDLINGGLQAMVKTGAVLSSALPEYQYGNPYPAASWKLPLATIDNVAKFNSDQDHLIIDVRENFRYRGESEPIDLVAGHIPGAVNIPYLTNMDAEGNFLSVEALAAKYKDALGKRSSKNVIVHCGSGVTACHTLLALDEAGIKDARLYVGSWSEWSRNNRTIAREE